VQINGTILHGWLLLCALSASITWWRTRYHSRTASRFIYISVARILFV
jgi:hypothetical protein